MNVVFKGRDSTQRGECCHSCYRAQFHPLAIERDLFCPKKRMTITENDRDILARKLRGEVRGEDLTGDIAVALTILKRVFDGKAKS